jgi:hypothetical protein
MKRGESKMVDQGKTNLNHQAVESGHLPADNGSLTSLARGSRIVLIWLARIFALCVVLQVFFAGAALFTNADYWAYHSNFPRFFAFIPIFMIVLSFFAKLPVSIRLKFFQLFGMIILIVLTVVLSSKIGILSALHPVIAVMLFMTSISIVNQIGASQKAHKAITVSNTHSQ